MRPDEITAILVYLASAYPGARWGEETATVWAEHLAGLDAGDVREAAREWVDRERWMPSIAELLDLAANIRRERVTAICQRRIRAASPAQHGRVREILAPLMARLRGEEGS